MTQCAAAALGALLLAGVAAAADSPSSSPRGRAAIAQEAVPLGYVNRYTIPHYYSVISGGGRSFTAVSIRNNSSVGCGVAVRFQRGTQLSDVCVVNQTIPAGQSLTYCSRAPGSFGAHDCQASCSPPLTFTAGHAFVASATGNGCANIAVHAEVVYTTDATDAVVTGLTRLTVGKFGQATRGD